MSRIGIEIREVKYRVAYLVADNLLLTSKWESCFCIRSLYCGGTLNLMSTNSVPGPDGPPCSLYNRVVRVYQIVCHFSKPPKSQLLSLSCPNFNSTEKGSLGKLVNCRHCFVISFPCPAHYHLQQLKCKRTRERARSTRVSSPVYLRRQPD